MKKLRIILLSLILCSFVASFSLSSIVFAETEPTATTATDTATDDTNANSGQGCGQSILTIPTWYRGLSKTVDGTCQIKSPAEAGGLSNFIWTIALNIVDILFQIIGYAAVIFIIIGGYFYITSNGDPNRMQRGLSTITSAVIGIAVAIGASSAVSLIIENTVLNSSKSAQEYVQGILNLAYTFAGIVAVVIIVLAGVRMATSNGDPANFTKARNAILYAVIGLVIVFAAWALTDFVIKGLS